MREITLFVVFVVHAAAFGHLYRTRGRRVFHLLFLAGFVLLTIFYGMNGWLFLTEATPQEPLLPPIRWTGLVLLGLATPPFLLDLYRRKRGTSSSPLKNSRR